MKRGSRLALAVFALGSAASLWAAAGVTRTGWISDDMCGAKHAGSGADCVKKCIQDGMKPVFVDDKKQVWKIDNPDSVKDFYGAKVTVKASENGTAKSVHIDSIAAAK